MPHMTTEQKASLAAAIAAIDDPSIDPQDDWAVANHLNRPVAVPGQSYRRRVPIGEVQTKAFELGLIYPLVQASKVAETASLAETVMEFFQGPHLDDVDMDKPRFREMLGGLKLIGVLNNTSEATILALADATTPAGETTRFREARGVPARDVFPGYFC